jgi:hypothetical protein
VSEVDLTYSHASPSRTHGLGFAKWERAPCWHLNQLCQPEYPLCYHSIPTPQITEYIEPYSIVMNKGAPKPTLAPSSSEFMKTFLETPYPQITRKI